MSRKSEQGQGRLGTVIWLLLAIALGTFAWKYIPARIQKAEMKDFVVDQTRVAGKATDKQIKKAIYGEAERLGITFEKNAITIAKRGGRVKIDYFYSLDLVYPGYTHVFEVDESVDRPFYNF